MPLLSEEKKQIKDLVAQCRKSLLAKNTEQSKSLLNSLVNHLPQNIHVKDKHSFIEKIRKLLIDDKELSSFTLFVSESLTSDKGFFIFVMALGVNTSVMELDLDSCKINAERAQVLAQVLARNSTLAEINLWNNNIGDDGSVAIAHALKLNANLERLYLGNNNIHADGAKALAQVLRLNSTLTRLSFWLNNIGGDAETALSQAVLDNTSLISPGWRMPINDPAEWHLTQNITNAKARKKESVLIRTQADFDKLKRELAEGERELQPIKDSVKNLCLIGTGGQGFLKLLDEESSNQSIQSNTEGSENSAEQLKNDKENSANQLKNNKT